jgi:type I restriction enzyme M protein
MTKPLRKKDLLPFNKDTGKGVFAKFQEILRHNNISDKSNVFNRFIALMLAKIVDETKLEDDELDFQFVEGVDTYEDFQDRLQKLYVKGMGKYLKETIVYHSNDEIEDIIKHFPRTSAKRRIKRLFREQKFYSNNDFAFIEVHNKTLFEQNVKVLKEVVQLLQSYRFKYTNKEPFLGNFFELMLNDGYKQSEGQFFTPLPIAKFMISSIPIKEIIIDKIKKEEDNILPYTIDYACGSGHFLTEAIDEIQHIIQQLVVEKPELIEQLAEYQHHTKWAGDYIFGIEKDYRLSRTSQVACFLNGDGDANIIFGDGLEDYPRLHYRNNEPIQFDVLIANPPYSVRDFKPHLRLQNNSFTLLNQLSESANEIEVLFIERMTQLLRIGGKAAIVLPNSVLQSGGIYSKARELLLRDFCIKGVVELGKNSFMATSIKPIILFLEKRLTSIAEDCALIAEDFILQNRKRPYDTLDSEGLLKAYCAYINIEYDEYTTLLAKNASDTLKESDFYKNYWVWFEKSAELKKIQQKANFQQGTSEYKKATTQRLFYELILKIEKEKFEFFMLTYQQTTIVVKTGNSTDAEKAFLGYSFSNRTGSEGMKEERDENGKLSTKLYDDESSVNYSKINSYIYQYFLNSTDLPTIDASLTEHLSYHPLTDLLSFDEVLLNNCIDTSFKSQIDYTDIWQLSKDKLVLLEQIAHGKKGKSITKSQVQKGEIPVIAGGKIPAYTNTVSNYEGNVITVSASGANAGYLWYHNTPIFASDCSVIFSKEEEMLPTRLLFHLLQYIQTYLYQLQRGQAQPHVYWRDLSKVLVPNIQDATLAQQLLHDLDDLEANKDKYLKGNVKVADIEARMEEQRRLIIEKALKVI